MGSIDLAGLYKFGIGVEQNNEEAINWYRKRCSEDINFEHFDPPAVGFIEWYHKAAEQSNVPAQLIFGYYYLYGLVCADGRVEKNIDEAIKWYSKAAEQGSAEAYFKLGEVHLGYTPGIEEDKEAALEWFNKAAELGDIYAKEYVLGLEERMRPRSDKHDKPFSLIALLSSIIFRIKCEKPELPWPITDVYGYIDAYHNPGEDFSIKIPTQIINEIFLSLRRMAQKGMLMFATYWYEDNHSNIYSSPPSGMIDYKAYTAEYFGVFEYKPILCAERIHLGVRSDSNIPILYTQYLDELGRFDPDGHEECVLFFSYRTIRIKSVRKEGLGRPEASIKVGKFANSEIIELAHTMSGMFGRTHDIITKEDLRDLWD